MSIRILIVEDTATEMQKACQAAKKLGLDIVCCDPTADIINEKGNHWMDLMEGVDGVATDLFWRWHEETFIAPWSGKPEPDYTYHPSRPSGLLVALHAISKDIPIVICSDVGDTKKSKTGHHGPEAGFIYDGYHGKTRLFGHMDSSRDPIAITGTFGWQDTKNWEWALRCLVLTISERQAQSRSLKRKKATRAKK